MSSVGWRDDAPIPDAGFACKKCYEVYSGNEDTDKTGGVDPTNETVRIGGRDRIEWSIMRSGTASNIRQNLNSVGQFPIFVFSIEELSTVDFVHIPPKSED